MTTVLNGANEVAVDAFLKGNIKFLDIPRVIENTMKAHSVILDYTMDDVFMADRFAKEYARSLL